MKKSIAIYLFFLLQLCSTPAALQARSQTKAETNDETAEFYVKGIANAETESKAKDYFPYKTMPPDEFAQTRFIKDRGNPYLLYQYSDAQLNIWIKRVVELMYGLVPAEYEIGYKKSFPHEKISPELYAAWFGHEIDNFDLHFWQYRDKQFEKWIRKLGKILYTDGMVERLRKELLTAEELFVVEKLIKDENAKLSPKEKEVIRKIYELDGRTVE